MPENAETKLQEALRKRNESMRALKDAAQKAEDDRKGGSADNGATPMQP